MSSILRKLPNSAGTKRLILFHHAGGNGAQYFPAFRPFAKDYEIYCMDLPGRFLRYDEPAYVNMNDLTTALKQQLQALPPLPTYLLGHSFGALVAYALATDAQDLVALKGLGISALRAPTPQNLSRYGGLSSLTDDQLLIEIEKYSEIPDVVKKHPALLSLTLAGLRSDFTVMQSFRHLPHQQKLNLPSLVFGGEQDPQVSLQDLLPWQDFVNTKKNPQLFTGDHFYIFNQMSKVLEELFRL